MRRNQRGNAMIELAIASAVILPLFAGTFQFGYALFNYNKLQGAVRAGARYASVRAYDSSTETPSAAFTAAVRNVVVYGSPAGGTQPIVTGLTTDMVNVSATVVSGVPDTVKVSISEIPIDLVFTTIRLTGKPVAKFRYSGRYAP
ncbi:MAG: pilus assembly protein [Acidobacteria bacterium]|nr:pilus assembly protein [Acidobacteriota bacterium]MBI3282114.1 pilus assembly protein [Acidobacteriota bacterium]